MQLIFAIFCIIFGVTVVVMPKREIIDLILMGKSYLYEDKLYRLDKIVIIFRIISGIVAAIGIYICLTYVYYMFINPSSIA